MSSDREEGRKTGEVGGCTSEEASLGLSCPAFPGVGPPLRGCGDETNRRMS